MGGTRSPSLMARAADSIGRARLCPSEGGREEGKRRAEGRTDGRPAERREGGAQCGQQRGAATRQKRRWLRRTTHHTGTRHWPQSPTAGDVPLNAVVVAPPLAVERDGDEAAAPEANCATPTPMMRSSTSTLTVVKQLLSRAAAEEEQTLAAAVRAMHTSARTLGTAAGTSAGES